MLSRITFKFKLVMTLVLVGILPLILLGFYLNLKNETMFEQMEIDKLYTLQTMKLEAVQKYFDELKNQNQMLANSIETKNLVDDLTFSFAIFRSELKIKSDEIAIESEELKQFYNKQFAATFLEKKKEPVDTDKILSSLSNDSIALQSYYIAKNEHPIGSKHLMLESKDNSSYSKLHQQYHPMLKAVLERSGLYDIFLVDARTGNVVYTVYKEIDFATSLLDGPYAKSGLAEAFRRAKDLRSSNESVFVDFKTYFPSFNAPAGFIATPIFKKKELVGVVIFQLPIDKINQVVSDRSGLGKTGESYLVGKDLLLRSSTSRRPDLFSLETSFGQEKKISSPTIQSVIGGEIVKSISKNYLNESVISVARPANIFGLDWYFVTEISTKEAFGFIDEVKKIAFTAIVVFGVIIFFVGLAFAKGIATPILKLSHHLATNTDEIELISADVSESAQRLGQSTTEQSSAIHETVASMEEMAAMLAQTSSNSEVALEVSNKGQHDVEKGQTVIQSLLTAMSDIQDSNRKLELIINSINEIKAKTQVINAIVSETRLLSFNASIEAARAGIHGKGFSVVAEEVGNLASMSGKAAQEINDLLENSTKEVTDIIKKTQDKVVSGIQVSQDCKNVFESMSEGFSKMVNSINMIDAASKEQESGVKQTNKAMNELETTTGLNSRNADNLSTKSQELERNASELQLTVKELQEFVLGGHTERVKSSSSVGKKVSSVGPKAEHALDHGLSNLEKPGKSVSIFSSQESGSTNKKVLRPNFSLQQDGTNNLSEGGTQNGKARKWKTGA